MTHLSAWAFAWAIALCAAALVACLITSEPKKAAEPEPIRVVLRSTQLGSYELPKPRDWEALAEIPAHIAKRSEPLWGDETELVRGHIRHEERQRRARAFAAQLDLPDPVYWLSDATDSAGCLTGEVA
ncbi:hypothetical protein P3T36_002966 [Kitasatospora sp. MAP12-15]|uniref:hypothetical protein n=1 Tax=unclassified Kitasatospora TaxID=2633591 RepID=UPI0024754CB5|nr:hypothetical protein [Kitasatospora sp. MAP12-44]MDH6108834.1 hypothetical protein [Kitasatospora sp. MAP12-44]